MARFRRLIVGLVAGAAAAVWVVPAAVASYHVVHPGRRHDSSVRPLGAAVTLVGRDGTRLAGHWWPAPGAPGTVVLLHGYGMESSQMVPYARFLHRAGFHVLTYDARAHGESAGATCTVGALEQEDLRGALDWLGRQGAVGPIGALGLSMGAATAVLAASQDTRLTAVVSESCFSTLRDLLDVAFPVFFHLPSFPYAGLAVPLAEWQAGMPLARLRPIDAIAGLGQRPVFVIGGLADRIATPAQTLALAQHYQRGQLWLVPGAGHTQGWVARPRDYERRVTAFFQASLATRLAGSMQLAVGGTAASR